MEFGMSRPLPIMTASQLRETLVIFLDQVMPACAQVDYRLVGTGAALLHGVALPAADVDILVRDRQSVDAFNSEFSTNQLLEPPTWLEWTHQYYANYNVNGIEVGISTVEIDCDVDTIETFGCGPWVHYTLLTCDRYLIPTVSIELRLITEVYRNRPDRYLPIIQFMQTHGCDCEFICRGMKAASVPQALQTELFDKLKDAPSRLIDSYNKI
jgi:hypothetical protein